MGHVRNRSNRWHWGQKIEKAIKYVLMPPDLFPLFHATFPCFETEINNVNIATGAKHIFNERLRFTRVTFVKLVAVQVMTK